MKVTNSKVNDTVRKMPQYTPASYPELHVGLLSPLCY
jgi:hypothetical protein